MAKKSVEAAAQQSFESTLSDLETIVTQLESGELALEDALNEFERGIQLARVGGQRLAEAEQRVQILLQDDAQAALTPFSPEDE